MVVVVELLDSVVVPSLPWLPLPLLLLLWMVAVLVPLLLPMLLLL